MIWNPRKLFNNYCRHYNTFENFDSWHAVMSLYHYFKPIHIVPNLKGSLSLMVRPSVIHQANQEVISIIEKTPQQGNGRKRKPYKKISDTLWAKIGKYALENSNTAASRKFSKELDSPLSESTVCSLKKSYTAALESKKHSITESTDDTVLSSLPSKK